MVLKKYPFGFKSYFEVDISQLVFKIGSNPNNIVNKQYLLHMERGVYNIVYVAIIFVAF